MISVPSEKKQGIGLNTGDFDAAVARTYKVLYACRVDCVSDHAKEMWAMLIPHILEIYESTHET